jgi:hypothetical protein
VEATSASPGPVSFVPWNDHVTAMLLHCSHGAVRVVEVPELSGLRGAHASRKALATEDRATETRKRDSICAGLGWHFTVHFTTRGLMGHHDQVSSIE